MKPQAIFVIAVAAYCASCARDEAKTATPPVSPAPVQKPPEPRAELDAAVVQLLELATRASNMIPAAPHVKTRSRMQEMVAAACLDLGAPERALTVVEPIENWRRGTGLADVAYYHAKHGQRSEAERLAKLAAEVAEEVIADPKEQEWRAGRVRAKLVRVYQQLGDDGQAAIYAEGLPDSELLHVERARADQASLAQLDAQLAGVDHALANGNYEVITAALEFCVRLHARFYTEAEPRAQLTTRITRAAEKLPRQHAVSLHLQLASAALSNRDTETAKEQIREARAILDFGRWAPEHKATLAAQIANRRAKAGDKERARFEIDEALALVETEHAKIIDIDRADALYPLAEAYHALGDMVACQQTYLQALDEALVNPNSVPRAEDLVAICLSMAKLSVTPDPTLHKRLTEAVGGLSNPW